jgi:hypothetical protein
MKKRKRVKREPNGQASRRKADVAARKLESELDVLSEPLKARARIYGLAEAVFNERRIGEPNANTHHGLLYFQRFIDRTQWNAAGWYLEKRDARLRAICAPGNAIVREGPSHDMADSDSYERWVGEITELWLEITDCLQQCSIVHRSPIISAFDVILERGKIIPHMMGDLRYGLNAIDRRFIACDRAKAA